MAQRVSITTTKNKVQNVLLTTFLTGLFLFSVRFLDLDLQKFMNRLHNAPNVIKKLMVLDFSNILAIYKGMFASILIAFSALSIGFLISLVLSFLAADNISPSKILSIFIKSGIAIIRSVPALIWILMVVASYGFGNTGGMLGLIFPTTGYLVKSFTASIEEIGYDSIEAMRATGASRIAIIVKALMPNLIRPFFSWTSMRLEGNIAESISLGMVGIGGIGSMLMKSLGKYDYGSISTIILVIFTTLFIVELVVGQLKKKL